MQCIIHHFGITLTENGNVWLQNEEIDVKIHGFYTEKLLMVPWFVRFLGLLIVALWRHMASWIWVNIGSGNGLLPDGTKPLPEPMLTYHQ